MYYRLHQPLRKCCRVRFWTTFASAAQYCASSRLTPTYLDVFLNQANPGKYALMICVELSSVHTTFDDNINDAILHAIFADGCAAAVLKGARKAECPKGTLAIVDNHAWLMEGTEDGITLAIKPNGITCTLSKFLPQYIAKNLSFFADGFLTKNKLTRSDGTSDTIIRSRCDVLVIYITLTVRACAGAQSFLSMGR